MRSDSVESSGQRVILLEGRVQALASRITWLMVLLVVALAGVGFLAYQVRAAASPVEEVPEESGPDVVQATRLELVDEQGQLLAELGVFEDGSRGLRLWDPEGRARAYFRLWREGLPSIGFLDEEGTMRTLIDLAPTGTPRIQLRGDDGRTNFRAP